MDSMWPVRMGGLGDERVTCFLYDYHNDSFIVGGITNSTDFAPAETDHAFLISLDSLGNMKWGNFFYEVSYPMSALNGCAITYEKEGVLVTGITNNNIVMAGINADTGAIQDYYILKEDGEGQLTEDNVGDVLDWGEGYAILSYTDKQNNAHIATISRGDDPKIDDNLMLRKSEDSPT